MAKKSRPGEDSTAGDETKLWRAALLVAAEYVPYDDIDPEITEKLDAIVQVAESATPADYIRTSPPCPFVNLEPCPRSAVEPACRQQRWAAGLAECPKPVAS